MSLPAPANQPNQPCHWTPRPVTVLLIDDQAIIGSAVRKLFESDAAIAFHHCVDSTQAIATAMQTQPSVILLDLVMPEIDGMTLLKFMRANRKLKEVPIIILTTKEDPKLRVEAFTLGATDFLMKLPEKTELLAKVRSLSAGYHALMQRDEVNAKVK